MKLPSAALVEKPVQMPRHYLVSVAIVLMVGQTEMIQHSGHRLLQLRWLGLTERSRPISWFYKQRRPLQLCRILTSTDMAWLLVPKSLE